MNHVFRHKAQPSDWLMYMERCDEGGSETVDLNQITKKKKESINIKAIENNQKI